MPPPAPPRPHAQRATPPRVLAGELAHAEALSSVASYGAAGLDGDWGVAPPETDMPFAASGPPLGASAKMRPEDIEHFCREGYVVLHGFYSAAQVAEMRTRMSALLSTLGAERAAQKQATSSDMFYGDLAFAPVDGPADALNPHRVGYVNDLHLHDTEMGPAE
jgi:hypothetical protein